MLLEVQVFLGASSWWDKHGTPPQGGVQEVFHTDTQATSTGSSGCQGAVIQLLTLRSSPEECAQPLTLSLKLTLLLSLPLRVSQPSQPLKKTHFSRLFLQSRSLGHYPKLMAFGEGGTLGQQVTSRALPFSLSPSSPEINRATAKIGKRWLAPGWVERCYLRWRCPSISRSCS